MINTCHGASYMVNCLIAELSWFEFTSAVLRSMPVLVEAVFFPSPLEIFLCCFFTEQGKYNYQMSVYQNDVLFLGHS